MANKEKNVEQVKEDLKLTKVNEQNIIKEVKDSFLEYAISVITDRALPDVRDGLKPVHRRVLYAAYGLGLASNKPHKKSARIVGEVIGKYHPHGDTAAYETMVRLAQNFSMRYPLIDGHGNFGTTDDSAAAMRYTEARLSKIGDIMLNDIEKDTVDYIDNYDGSEKEPSVLTSIIPNLLANGTSGIAVAMATNIPPHNLLELYEAIKMVAANPNVSIEEIKTYLKGPDFPTGGEIIDIDGIDDYFRTGKGSIRIRAKTEIKYHDNNKSSIVILELPYGVGKKALIDKIVDLVKEKSIEGIADIQDYSSLNEGTRIEIETKKDIIPEVLLNQLYKKTSLQISFAINMNVLVNGTPKILNIVEVINEYLAHQIDVLTRKLNNELKKSKEREHILEGLYIATNNIDSIISIIRNANENEEAINLLISKFNLTEIQAKAILDMKLRALGGIERKKIEDELNGLKTRINEINEILSDRNKKIDLIINELGEIVRKYGDNRRSVIRGDISSNISNEDLIPKENILITLSARSYLKRIPIDTYKTQKRGGVGVIGLQTHEDDDVEKIISATTHTDLLIFTDFGKVYKIRGHQVPSGSRTSKGIPAINIIDIEKNEKVVSILPINSYENGDLFFATIHGIVKKTKLSEFERVNKNGKIAILLKENDKLFDIVRVNDEDNIYMGADNGKLISFHSADVRSMGRNTSGVKGMKLMSKENIIGLSTSKGGNKILSIGSKGVGKMSDIEDYRETKRNAKGVTTIKVSEKTGKLVYTGTIDGSEDALMITSKGKIIRFPLNSLRTLGRSTSGVRLMKVEENEKIKSVTIFEHDENLLEEEFILEEVNE